MVLVGGAEEMRTAVTGFNGVTPLPSPTWCENDRNPRAWRQGSIVRTRSLLSSCCHSWARRRRRILWWPGQKPTPSPSAQSGARSGASNSIR